MTNISTWWAGQGVGLLGGFRVLVFLGFRVLGFGGGGRVLGF